MMRTADVRPGARWARPRRDTELILQLGQRGGVKRLRAAARQPAAGDEPGAITGRYALDRPARERHLEPREPGRRRVAHGALPAFRAADRAYQHPGERTAARACGPEAARP